MTSFYDLLKSRRSIRKYQSKAVEPDKIELITRAALMSPASKRRNPWEFIVVQDHETLSKLSQTRTYGSQLLAGSPLGIVVVADKLKSDIWYEDATIAGIVMQLQAHDLGLGSCWVQVHERESNETGISADAYIRSLLNIPDNYAVMCVISIGYAAEEKEQHDDNALQTEKIHYETF